MNLSELFRELRRRKVFRVAVVYAVVGWLVIQVAHIVLPGLGLPGWPVQLVIVLVLLGFPVALVLGWAFDLTPEGVRRDSGVVDAAPAEAGGATPVPRRGRGAGALAVLPFALAYAALGDAYLVLPFYDPSVSVPERVELARTAALRALPLDPGLGEVHATLGQASTFSWDWEGAERHFGRAPETLGSSWDLARFQVYLGDAGAALRSLERAVDARETYGAWVAADPTIVAFLIDEPRFRELARRIGVPLA